jgi:hypothetical protein
MSVAAWRLSTVFLLTEVEQHVWRQIDPYGLPRYLTTDGSCIVDMAIPFDTKRVIKQGVAFLSRSVMDGIIHCFRDLA